MFGIEIRHIAGTRNGWEVLGYNRIVGYIQGWDYVIDARCEKVWY